MRSLARVGFTLTVHERQVVYDICQPVAGLPLEIGLAASDMRANRGRRPEEISSMGRLCLISLLM
jgi:predicted ATPase